MNASSIFAYVDGDPLAGLWIAIEEGSGWDEIREALLENGWCTGDYDGDILVADTAGFAGHFLGRYGNFDMEGFNTWAKAALDGHFYEEEVIVAYLEWQGANHATPGHMRESYTGTYRDAETWAEQYLDDTDLVRDVPEAMRPYINFDAYARDAQLSGDVHFAYLPGGGVAVFWNN